MDTYIVLRNNREYGPFSFQELKTAGIYTTDLVWIEGISTAWQLASDISEIESVCKTAPVSETITANRTLSNLNASFNSGIRQEENPGTSGAGIPYGSNNDENDFLASPGKDMPLFTNRKKSKRPLSINFSFFSLVVLLIGAMMGAFVVKQMVDNFHTDTGDDGVAREFEPEQITVSAATHAAKSDEALQAKPLENIVTAKDSVKLMQPSKTSGSIHKTIDTTKDDSRIKPKETTVLLSGNLSTDPAPDKEVTEKGETELKKPDVKPGVVVSANDYRVGLFGGISGLEITVSNPSGQHVERAVIEVEFLKPNGSVVKSQTVEVQDIASGNSKTVPVPSSKRGVKVRYHVVSINNKEE